MKVTLFLLAVMCASALASFPVNNVNGYHSVGFGGVGSIFGHGNNYGYQPYGYNNHGYNVYNGYNGGYNGYNGYRGPKSGASYGHLPYGYGYNNGYSSYNNYYPQH